MAVTTLTIQLVPNAIANTVVVSIPQSLQSLEASGSGSAATQAVAAIFKAGVFLDSSGRWWSAFQVLSITAS